MEWSIFFPSLADHEPGGVTGMLGNSSYGWDTGCSLAKGFLFSFIEEKLVAN